MKTDSAQCVATAPRTRGLKVVDATNVEEGRGSEAEYNGVAGEPEAEGGDDHEWGLESQRGAFKATAKDVEELGQTAFEGKDKREAERQRLLRIGARCLGTQTHARALARIH